MNSNNFINRLVVFSLGGHEIEEVCDNVIVIMPEGTCSIDFKNAYNAIVEKMDADNAVVRRKLDDLHQRRKVLGQYIMKYDGKETIALATAQKLVKTEKELNALMQEFKTLNARRVRMEFEDIIKSIGGAILEEQISAIFTDRKNSMIID